MLNALDTGPGGLARNESLIQEILEEVAMNRRLFFLFPDREHALQAVDELVASGVDRARMHTIARDDIPLDDLPKSTSRQRKALAKWLEFWAWRADLVVFFVSLLAFIALLIIGSGWWWLPLVLAVGSYLAGEHFTHLPNTHRDEFAEAIHHGEILLMVDVDAKQISVIEHRLRRHHPEAVPGGATWSIPAFDL